MAFCRLRRMRLNDAASEPISSLLSRTSSGVSNWPRLTLLAMSEISSTGFTTIARTKRSTRTMTTRKIPASTNMNHNKTVYARSNGSASGIETAWAPTMSPTFQPKPWSEP